MNKIYTKEEFKEIANKLGWKNHYWFAGFIANDYDLFQRPDGLEDRNLIIQKEKDFYYGKIKGIIDNLQLDISAAQSTHSNILQIIEIVKFLHMDYLMNKFKDQIDIQTAENLVNYAFTNGACRSLANLLCDLFPECQLTRFQAGRYCHVVAKLDDVYYDIFGASSSADMGGFCAIQGQTTPDKYSEESISLDLWRINLFELAVMDYIKNTHLLEKSDADENSI